MVTRQNSSSYKNTTIESFTFASLSIGLWSVSSIGYLTSGMYWATYILTALGAISALLASYLILPFHWKQDSVANYLEIKTISKVAKLLVFVIIFTLFGLRLFQTGVVWMVIAGISTMIFAFIAFYIGIWQLKK